MEIPIILSLYLKPLKAFLLCFIVTNSALKTDVSTVDCFFESHCNNAVIMYTKKPLLELQDTFLLHGHFPKT